MKRNVNKEGYNLESSILLGIKNGSYDFVGCSGAKIHEIRKAIKGVGNLYGKWSRVHNACQTQKNSSKGFLISPFGWSWRVKLIFIFCYHPTLLMPIPNFTCQTRHFKLTNKYCVVQFFFPLISCFLVVCLFFILSACTMFLFWKL